MGLLLLVDKEGNLLLQALHAGRHFLHRLYCCGKSFCMMLSLMEFLAGCHVCLLGGFDSVTQVGEAILEGLRCGGVFNQVAHVADIPHLLGPHAHFLEVAFGLFEKML